MPQFLRPPPLPRMMGALPPEQLKPPPPVKIRRPPPK
jgi:hypothetical protein